MVEKITINAYDVESFYQDKEQNLRSFQNLDAKILNGKLSVMSGVLFSQENLLSFSGVALPNFTQITAQDLSFLKELLERQTITNSELNQFFSSFLLRPLSA